MRPLNGIPLEQREGHRRKGLYIPPPFRGWSIRLRGKISIRNDIERLIRKGWNPFAFELDRCSLHCRDSFLSFPFFLFFGGDLVCLRKLSAVVFWGNWDDYYDGIYVEYEFHVQLSNIQTRQFFNVYDDRLWTYRNFLIPCTIGRSLYVRDDILLLLNRIGHSLHVIDLFLFLWNLNWYLILSYFIAIKRKPYEYNFCSHVRIELSWGIKLFTQFDSTITRK